MRVLTFNAWIGQDATDDRGRDDLLDHVRHLLAVTEFPEVATLQEVWDWRETVPGYRRVQASRKRYPRQEARSTILLVRRDLQVVAHGAVEAYGGGWTGPKHGTPHDARVFPWVAARQDAQSPTFDVMGVHRTREAWSRDGKAYHGEHRAIVEWSRRRRPGPLVVAGDHNGPMEALARDLGGQARLRGIDGVVVRGAAVAGQRRVPGDYGSDGHHPVLTRLVARPRA